MAGTSWSPVGDFSPPLSFRGNPLFLFCWTRQASGNAPAASLGHLTRPPPSALYSRTIVDQALSLGLQGEPTHLLSKPAFLPKPPKQKQHPPITQMHGMHFCDLFLIVPHPLFSSTLFSFWEFFLV